MKRKVIILAITSLVIIISNLFFKSNSKSILITDFDLLNIEALAQNEREDDNQWYQPETRRCKLELGGGWFESSVERVCVFCAVPYSCTSVACGGLF